MKANIRRSDKHPWEWEKKGAKLYHPKNMRRYPWLRHFTLRLCSKIQSADGFVFYCGLKKTASPEEHNPRNLYRSILRQSVKRIDQFCDQDCSSPEGFVMLLDEHDQRTSLLSQAAQSMYGSVDQCKRLVRAAVSYGESPLLKSASCRLDCRTHWTDRNTMGGPQCISRKRGLRALLWLSSTAGYS